MKRRIVHTVFTLLAILVLLPTQGCREQDDIFQVVVIDTQEELEELILGQSAILEGPIILSGSISSLEVFSNVEKIFGNFAIVDTQLTTLDGLENLTLVTGDITITSNPLFSKISATFVLCKTSSTVVTTSPSPSTTTVTIRPYPRFRKVIAGADLS